MYARIFKYNHNHDPHTGEFSSVMYHGTAHSFDTFDHAKGVTWFTPDKGLAKFYADVRSEMLAENGDTSASAKVMERRVQMQKPARFNFDMSTSTPEEARASIARTHPEIDLSKLPKVSGKRAYPLVTSPEMLAQLKAHGYDGIVVNEAGKPTYGVLDPKQAVAKYNHNHGPDGRFTSGPAISVDALHKLRNWRHGTEPNDLPPGVKVIDSTEEPLPAVHQPGYVLRMLRRFLP